MTQELPKQYAPDAVEERWKKFWLENQVFDADDERAGYGVTLPPPNVTGSLHMGHALGDTLQDIIVRWQRMKGTNPMWMPGMDHAGIATQMLVERLLNRTEGISRYDIGREEFLKRVWAWKEKYGGKILEQLQVMGFSLDWPRQRFTMDDESSKAVTKVFIRLYEEGLIYRANRLINWCTSCRTAVSDLEVNNVEESGHLWELEYPYADGSGSLIVATTRPETMLGDTAVAVHPDDERYQGLIGKTLSLPLCNREIPVVADSFVDPDFGSGAVKVTPAHDPNDFECGKRLGLPSLSVISEEGIITSPAPEDFVGLSVADARKKVVSDLDALGLLKSTKDHSVPKGRCDRCKTVIEPMLSQQWFVKADVLAKPAIEAVEQGKTKFVPELWTKTYMHWMKNIRDWCISRQLWWGHRIPAWHCQSCGDVAVAESAPEQCGQCSSSQVKQDEDVLDTWFSSALWPFSTLGWPNETAGLKAFYPNQLLVTAPDIIFFWVARMMMMGIHFMGDVPFYRVFLTPVVTDDQGDKMSKTKGNVVDPLDVIRGATGEELLARAEENNLTKQAIKTLKKKFPDGIAKSGGDALRFTLAAMTMPGRNIKLSMERVEGYRNFINKLWNASRFAMMNLDGETDISAPKPTTLSNQWICSRLASVIAQTEHSLEELRFAEATNTLYHFVWGDFCDWYIELSKAPLRDNDTKQETQVIMAFVLEQALRLLHPFVPFVTEEIWAALPVRREQDCLTKSTFPVAKTEHANPEVESEMELLQGVISAIRTLRSTYNVPPSQTVRAILFLTGEEERITLTKHQARIEELARVELAIETELRDIPNSAKEVVRSQVEVVVPLAELIDLEKEQARLEKAIGKLDKQIAATEKKLGNERFIANAPPEVIEEQKRRLTEETQKRQQMVDSLKQLQG